MYLYEASVVAKLHFTESSKTGIIPNKVIYLVIYKHLVG
jgi:hypothetical protein